MFEENRNHRLIFTFSKEIVLEDTMSRIIDYEDKGWLNSGIKPCNHKKDTIDNSLYENRATDIIYICHECKASWHVDMSD